MNHDEEIAQLKAQVEAVTKERDEIALRRGETLAMCEQLRQELAAATARIEQLDKELQQRKGWQYCKIHEKINANYAWGCPDCIVEQRTRIRTLEEALKKIAKPALGGKLQQQIAQAALAGKEAR